jgi:type VI secretion system protein ImpA
MTPDELAQMTATLSKPLAPEACGKDLRYEPEFDSLEGKLQVPAGEEPKWAEIRDASLALLARGKDLRVGVIFALALLRTDGLAGFRAGLEVLTGWLETYWAGVHPRVEDANPQAGLLRRKNALQNLSCRTFGDPYRVVDRLRAVPLVDTVTLNIAAVAGGDKDYEAFVPENKRLSSSAIIQVLNRSVERKMAGGAQAKAIQGILARLENLLNEKMGVQSSPDFQLLKGSVDGICRLLVPGEPPPAQASSPGEPPPPPAARAGIGSREDVLKAIEQIKEYYAKNEPTSPVPFLLNRASQLVNMDFRQIMGNLSPEAVKEMGRLLWPDAKE